MGAMKEQKKNLHASLSFSSFSATEESESFSDDDDDDDVDETSDVNKENNGDEDAEDDEDFDNDLMTTFDEDALTPAPGTPVISSSTISPPPSQTSSFAPGDKLQACYDLLGL